MKIIRGSLVKSIASLAMACVLALPVAADEKNAEVANSLVTTETQQSQMQDALPINPVMSRAADVKPNATAPKTGSAAQLANLLGGLAVIIALIFGLSWFVKRFSQGGFMHNSAMKVVSSMPLGTRERLMLVEIGNKQLLLGVTTTQINTLHVFDEPVFPTDKSGQPASEFSQKLMAILQQKNFVQPNDSSRKS